MNDTRCRSECRPGFTLLELMIALSILSTLMLVAWSMLASFRDVQEKGRVQATKTQTIRSIRLWLEEDALHLASPFQATANTRAMRGPSSSRNAFTTGRRPSGGAINNSTNPLPTNVDLIGTPTSIQWTIDSASSPTQTFRQLFDSLDETVARDDTTRRARSAQDSSPDSRINPRFAASRLSEPTTLASLCFDQCRSVSSTSSPRPAAAMKNVGHSQGDTLQHPMEASSMEILKALPPTDCPPRDREVSSLRSRFNHPPIESSIRGICFAHRAKIE